MGKRWKIGLCTLLMSGCTIPIKVRTESAVTVRQPVKSEVRTEYVMHVDPGPLNEIALGTGECCRCEAKVAVIELDGILNNSNFVGLYSAGENPVAVFKEKLDAAAADPTVRCVVLRINSPGGSVAATDLLCHDLREFRQKTGKPVVALLMDIGAGGAYYLATAADTIIATPSSTVGGIGVLLNLYQATLAMEQLNFFDMTIRQGEHIDMASPVRKLTEEEKTLFNDMAKEFHARFKEAILVGRSRVKVNEQVFDGRIMSAKLAIEAGLVDRTGYLEDAIATASALADVKQAKTVMYRRSGDPARTLYATTSNRPIQNAVFPWSVPGADRARLPLFLYMWQADPNLLRLTGL